MKKQTITNYLLKALILLFMAFILNDIEAQVTISEQPWVLPTYQVAPADKNPIFFKYESYQGASKYVYPYALNDVISVTKTDKAWKTLLLENEYIKVCVTPEIGGKLYYATDKSNNYNFIYKNTVVKPSNIGMTGAWVSGGIEWCVLHHHRVSCFLPVDYALRENPDGSKTIQVGETDLRHRMRWTVGITMFPGKSYFQAEVKITNPTPYTWTFLNWANVAAHTNENYQVFFPPSVQYATYHAKNSFTHWPISTGVYNGVDFKGVDVSWWKNVLSSNSFFAYDLKEDFMGGYDHGKESGTVHIGDHNIVKGAKLWEWGSGPRGQATEARLTDNDGPYVEIMVGTFSDNQPDYSWIRPYEVKTFKQYWYPVKDIQGFRNANLNGAVNLEAREKNSVFLGYYSTQKVPKAKITLKRNDKVIFEKALEISPVTAFTQTITIDGAFKLTDLYTEMVNEETGEVLVSYQPVEQKYDESLPEIVKAPPLPKEIATVEELFLTGNRIEQFYNPRYNPMDYYQEALLRDPNDIRTNTAVGSIYLKNGDYENARKYLGTAIKRLTKDYTRPSTCEPLYYQGLVLKALELYDEAADTLYRATWDYAFHSAGYMELAQISSIRGDLTKALAQIEESLSTNTHNNRAIGLKASLQRKLKDFKGASETIAALSIADPLDFRIANEKYLIAKESGNAQAAEKELASLTIKMRDYDNNYLELAVGYLNDGMVIEAEDVLNRFKGKQPIVSYYKGYIQDKKGNRDQASSLFKEASSLSTDYVFPFRLETVKVLSTALKYNPNDGRAYYYLGNILFDKQPEKAIKNWETSVKLDPSLAVAHRNLGWGYSQYFGDGLKAIASYEKAISLNKNEPIYYTELDALYEMANTSVEKRLKLFAGNDEIVGKRDDSFVRQLTVLTLAGESQKAVDYLAGRKFSYREGNSRVREIIIDAQLMLGKKYFEENKYKEALDHFLLAQVPEEEASGPRASNRNIQVHYYIGLAYEAMKNRTKARNYFTLSSNQDTRGTNFMSYYQGLSYLKLGKTEQAKQIFNSMVADASKQIEASTGGENDFFAKFSEQETENVRLSNAYLLKGLGNKGLGDVAQATSNLKKAVELSAANLYAKVELEHL